MVESFNKFESRDIKIAGVKKLNSHYQIRQWTFISYLSQPPVTSLGKPIFYWVHLVLFCTSWSCTSINLPSQGVPSNSAPPRQMVLVIGDQLVKEVPCSSLGVYSTWGRLKDTGHSLTSIPIEPVGSRGLLYMRPREYAVTVPHDDAVHFMGSDDATTSVMAVLRHTGEGIQAYRWWSTGIHVREHRHTGEGVQAYWWRNTHILVRDIQAYWGGNTGIQVREYSRGI